MELHPWQIQTGNGTLSLTSHLVPVGMVPSASWDPPRDPFFTPSQKPVRRRDPRRPDPTGPMLAALEASSAASSSRPRWSITLASPRLRRPRWLAENGRFTSDPARALQLVSPEVAVRRLHAYLELRGWPSEALERFRLVPAPGQQTAAAIDHLGSKSSSAA